MGLDSTQELITSTAAGLSLLTIHIERDDRGVCFIGVPAEISAGSLWLQALNHQAEWDDTLSRWKYREITRL